MKTEGKVRTWMPLLLMLLVSACIGHSILTYAAPEYEVSDEQTTEEVSLPQVLPELARPSEAKKTQPAAKGSKKLAAAKDPGDYKDGVYRGTGIGFNGKIVVDVTIKDGKIARITIVKHGEDQPYFNKAKAVISRILSKQSTNVDAVSGATYSSNGIIRAVRNALKKAAISKKAIAETKKDPTKKEESGTKKDETDSGGGSGNGSSDDEEEDETNGVLRDGNLYTVTVQCQPDARKQFNAYDTTIQVEVVDLKVVAVTVLSMKGTVDDRRYHTNAAKYFTKQLKKGAKASAGDFDVLSGATCSSESLKEACRLALLAAKKYEEQNASEETGSGTDTGTDGEGTGGSGDTEDSGGEAGSTGGSQDQNSQSSQDQDDQSSQDQNDQGDQEQNDQDSQDKNDQNKDDQEAEDASDPQGSDPESGSGGAANDGGSEAADS